MRSPPLTYFPSFPGRGCTKCLHRIPFLFESEVILHCDEHAKQAGAKAQASAESAGDVCGAFRSQDADADERRARTDGCKDCLRRIPYLLDSEVIMPCIAHNEATLPRFEAVVDGRTIFLTLDEYIARGY